MTRFTVATQAELLRLAGLYIKYASETTDSVRRVTYMRGAQDVLRRALETTK